MINKASVIFAKRKIGREDLKMEVFHPNRETETYAIKWKVIDSSVSYFVFEPLDGKVLWIHAWPCVLPDIRWSDRLCVCTSAANYCRSLSVIFSEILHSNKILETKKWEKRVLQKNLASLKLGKKCHKWTYFGVFWVFIKFCHYFLLEVTKDVKELSLLIFLK